jgi:nucleotide-binding universal stress UspA family protein
MLKILVPVDFSPESNNASQYAIKMAKAADKAVITIYHAIYIKDVMADLLEKVKDVLIDETERELATILKKCENKGLTNTTFKTLHSFDYPDESILKIASEHKKDVVIMGTKGTSGLEKIFIGSVASKVIEKAKIPVLVVPEEYNSSRQKINEIMFASDLENIDNRIKIVVALAKLFNAEIQVLHVLPESSNLVLNAEKMAKDLSEKHQYDKIKFFSLMESSIEKGIERFIEDKSPDLMVMYPQKRSFLEKLLSYSKTRNMAEKAEVPVLAVPTIS